MKTFLKIAAAVLIGTTALAGAAVAAPTITFEGFSDDYSSTQVYNGYSFAFAASGWGVVTTDFSCCTGANVQNGTRRLMLSGGTPGSVTITKVGGGTFSVGAFDAATSFLRTSGTMSVIGTYSNLTTVSTSFSLVDSYAAFLLPGTFSNLISIRFAEGTNSSFQQYGIGLDNILIDPGAVGGAVPEPATWAMMLFGFGAIGIAARRKRVSVSALV